jgi:hypothetical protein
MLGLHVLWAEGEGARLEWRIGRGGASRGSVPAALRWDQQRQRDGGASCCRVTPPHRLALAHSLACVDSACASPPIRLLLQLCLLDHKENFAYEHWDEILDICR